MFIRTKRPTEQKDLRNNVHTDKTSYRKKVLRNKVIRTKHPTEQNVCKTKCPIDYTSYGTKRPTDNMFNDSILHSTHMLITNFSALKDKILFKFPITESSMLVANWSKHNFANIYRIVVCHIYIYHCFSEKHWTANGFYIFAILRQRATTFPYAIKGPNFYCGTIPFIPFLISHVHQRQCSSPLNFVCVLFSVRKS